MTLMLTITSSNLILLSLVIIPYHLQVQTIAARLRYLRLNNQGYKSQVPMRRITKELIDDEVP